MPYRARSGSFVASLGLIVSAAVVGCADKGAQQIRPESFYSGGSTSAGQPANSTIGANPTSTSDRSGSLYTQVGNGIDVLKPPGEGESNEAAVKSVSPVVRDSVQSPEAAATRASASASPSGAISAPRPTASTQATTRGKSSGQYVTIGGVVAEVNGTPIYANKVLKALDATLAAKAKELDEKKFEKAATDLISKQVQEYVSAELEFAAAERNLQDQDKTLADTLTMQWRSKRIIEAGGSVEVARKRATADGEDFEDLVHQQYRLYLIRIFYEKRVIPRIQVTAEDMRRYYQLNKDKEFTDQDQVQFRLIKIDPRKSGGKEKAIDKAADIRKRAADGADFAMLAESNDDSALMKAQGKVGGGDGWIQRGAFTLTKVENAVFKLQPGEVTDVIEENGSYYVAKLENRKIGRVLPFEDESVQDKIRTTLRKAQFAVLREQVQQALRKNAVIRIDDGMVETALDMAMQSYPSWSAGA